MRGNLHTVNQRVAKRVGERKLMTDLPKFSLTERESKFHKLSYAYYYKITIAKYDLHI